MTTGGISKVLRSLVCFFVVTLLSGISIAADQRECSSSEICVSIAAFEAASSALKQFRIDQPKAQTKHFSILIQELPDHFDIEFVPDLTPTKSGSNGEANYMEIPSGGANRYGRDVLYQVSKASGKILKVLYSK